MDYNFRKIEKKWQDKWKNEKTFATKDTGKEKYYVLEMFPYPSGKIHMGHVANYTIADCIARYYALSGFDVLHPMGFDAFGMPAENAAIDNKTHPAKWTYKNIESMTTQLNLLGYSYDWDRQVITSDPEYYKWGQWFILKMYEKGLLYKKMGEVNWCESCKTVLANEQVSTEGTCWRCNNEVTKKQLEQWYIKITDYVEQLIDDLDSLEGKWPDNVIAMQRNWIGKSVGANINFKLDDGTNFPIFTTRPDTVYGVTYMAIAWNHKDLLKICTDSEKSKVEEFINKSAKIDQKTDYEKEGVFTGRYVINPFNNDKVPLYAANFVLAEYGSGCIMAVPAHDERDFQFAKKYNIPLKIVIQNKETLLDISSMKNAYTEDGVLVNSDILNGLNSAKAIEKAIEYAESKGFGKSQVQYRLRDWLVSRQRYWGNPIPFINCPKCGVVPVAEKDLPVLLPNDIEFTVGVNPLTKSTSFLNTTCPKCGGSAMRETDTMDTFTCSSWYYARYTDAKNDKIPFEKSSAKKWLPVDQYIGGIEHACLHLLYARFWNKFMRDIGMLENDEPFMKLLTQGMVLSNSYMSKKLKKFYTEDEFEREEYKKDGLNKEDITVKMEKMSKSKLNGIDPTDIIENYGADAVRIFVMFVAPPEKDKEWSDDGVKGSFRFLTRIWNYSLKFIDDEKFKAIKNNCFDSASNNKIIIDDEIFNKLSTQGKVVFRKYNRTVEKFHIDVKDKFHFNTAIAAMMELLNEITPFNPETDEDYTMIKSVLKAFLILLNPIAPHISEELYSILGYEKNIINLTMPQFDKKYLSDDTFELVFQINGKLRDRIDAPMNITEENAKKSALDSEKIKEFLKDKEVLKVVYVKNKLVNIVVK